MPFSMYVIVGLWLEYLQIDMILTRGQLEFHNSLLSWRPRI